MVELRAATYKMLACDALFVPGRNLIALPIVVPPVPLYCLLILSFRWREVYPCERWHFS